MPSRTVDRVYTAKRALKAGLLGFALVAATGACTGASQSKEPPEQSSPVGVSSARGPLLPAPPFGYGKQSDVLGTANALYLLTGDRDRPLHAAQFDVRAWRWRELARPPAWGSLVAMRNGLGIVAMDRDCPSRGCTEDDPGTPTSWVNRTGSGRWNTARLEPRAEVDDEFGIDASGIVSGTTWLIRSNGSMYGIDEKDHVRRGSDAPRFSSPRCIARDHAIALTYSDVRPPLRAPRVFDGVRSLNLTAPHHTWRAHPNGATPELGTGSAGCGPDGPVVLTPGATLGWDGERWIRLAGADTPTDAFIIHASTGPVLAKNATTVFVLRDGRWRATPINTGGGAPRLHNVTAAGMAVIAWVGDGPTTQLRVIA